MTARWSLWGMLCLVVLGACNRERSLGGPWVLLTRDTFSESGSSQPRLYYKAGGERIFVDGFVHLYRIYERGECIAYKTTRDWWYAACAGRQPVKLSALDVRGIGPDGWQLRSCGLITTEPASNVNDQSKRFIFRTEAFLRVAREQPPLRDGWWQRPADLQKIGPEMVDGSAVCSD